MQKGSGGADGKLAAIMLTRRETLAALGGCLAAPLFVGCAESGPEPVAARMLQLPARRRAGPDGAPEESELLWKAAQTAVIICDMWDRHWCLSASDRVAEMAPEINRTIEAARELGVRIVHAPSGTVDYYADTRFRERILAAPRVEPPVPIEAWCYLEEEAEGPLPIDDSEGGCDDDPPSESEAVWTRQHPAIEMKGEDVVSDSGVEIYSYFAQQGVKNVALMGVHTNMCVLGRSFGIRQMVKLGMDVVLVRDLTDALYDPRDEPYVSHERGTELVIEHIERHWCPSVMGAALMSTAISV